ncbi:hypothetical protein PR048_024226 [Dryococelus australis]|uniref:Uncharacterized protein n=1 Tax=Dryococelus australis TaxID=614101 RepID=A0ABQ9GN36_9NEOP|nr:hypothetical protein PR048_024226 [Dryococelus australis]
MRVIDVSMEQRRDERAEETGDPRGEDPPTNGIVRHDSHMRKSGVIRPRIEPGSSNASEKLARMDYSLHERMRDSHGDVYPQTLPRQWRGAAVRQGTQLASRRARGIYVNIREPLVAPSPQRKGGARDFQGIPWDRRDHISAPSCPPSTTTLTLRLSVSPLLTASCNSFGERRCLEVTPAHCHVDCTRYRIRRFWNSAPLYLLEQCAALSSAALDWWALLHHCVGSGLQVSEEIWAALNIDVLRVDEGEVSAGMQYRGRRESTEKTRRPAAYSGTIPTCENPPGIERGAPRWEASSLTTTPPRNLLQENTYE